MSPRVGECPRIETPKRVAIVQSNYIPWKGYFDLINSVDEFILFDDVQFTKRDWRNRNTIKTPDGLLWLTIPVSTKGKYHESIRDIRVSDKRWVKQHWRTLTRCYSRAAYFREYRDRFSSLYDSAANEDSLSEINRLFLESICGVLGICTRISSSADYELCDGRNERLISLCQQSGASVYLSGGAARRYLDEDQFHGMGIRVEWMSYENYPEYKQLHGAFEHHVSVVDLLFNEGPRATKYMLSF